MRKSTSSCFASASFLALVMCAQTTPTAALSPISGLGAVSNPGSIVLVADEKKSDDTSAGEATPQTTKKARKKRASTKDEVEKGIKKYVPKEYQQQIQQYMQQGVGQGGMNQ